MKITNYEVGDICYFADPIDDTCKKVKIKEINTDKKSADVIDENDELYRYGVPFRMLYDSETDCRIAIDDKQQKVQKRYESEINSVEDLVRFMFHYDISSDEYNWQARKVAREKAKELLGIELKD